MFFKVYFECNFVCYLEYMVGIKKVFLVCDFGMVEFGYVD